MNKIMTCLAAFLAAISLQAGDGEPLIVATANVHGCWFDANFISGKTRASLLQLSEAVNGIRSERGAGNLLLVDICGALEGHNAAFYYNKVAEGKEHLYPRMASYMKYDAVMAGPDVKLGKALMRRIRRQMRKAGIPYLYGGASCVVSKAGCRFGMLDSEDAAKAERFLKKKELDYVLYRQGNKLAVFDGDTVLVADPGRSCRHFASVEPSSGKLAKNYVSLKNRDELMWDTFKADYAEVAAFVGENIAELALDLDPRSAYEGQSDYMNFYHSLALSQKGVDISMAGPLSLDGVLKAGPVSYGRIFKLYPFDNKIVVLSMSGEEVKAFLEASYDTWFRTRKLANFDSAGGLCYTVDPSKAYGERVEISSFADGRPFEVARRYKVSMSSYRAVGAGGLLKAAGLPDEESIASRKLLEGDSFRELLYYFLLDNKVIDKAVISNPELVGSWSFVTPPTQN